MPKKLTKLRIDEISSVDHGAGEGCHIVLMKRDSQQPPTQGARLFNDIIKANEESDEDKLSNKLMQMVDAMILAEPTLTEEDALFHLLNHPQGRKLAEHFNNLSKGELQMPQVDIAKLLEISEAGLNAQVTRRDGESFAKAFTRKYETDIDYRRQWKNFNDVKMNLAPTRTEAGSVAPTAYDELVVKANDLRKSDPELTQAAAFAKVYEDPDNIAIVKRERNENRPQ